MRREEPYRYYSIIAFTVIAIVLLIISPLLYVANTKVDKVKSKYNEVEATKSEVITAKTLAENNIFKTDRFITDYIVTYEFEYNSTTQKTVVVYDMESDIKESIKAYINKQDSTDIVIGLDKPNIGVSKTESKALFIIGLVCGILSLILKALFGKDIEAFYNKQSADELDIELEEAEEAETNTDENGGEQ